MPRGGRRPRKSDGSTEHLIKPKWKLGQTRTIRVPVVLADQLLEIAHKLDEGETIDLTQDKKSDGEQADIQADIYEVLIELLQKAIASKNITGMRRLNKIALGELLMRR